VRSISRRAADEVRDAAQASPPGGSSTTQLSCGATLRSGCGRVKDEALKDEALKDEALKT
jgi:hypothetical protein